MVRGFSLNLTKKLFKVSVTKTISALDTSKLSAVMDSEYDRDNFIFNESLVLKMILIVSN